MGEIHAFRRPSCFVRRQRILNQNHMRFYFKGLNPRSGFSVWS